MLSAIKDLASVKSETKYEESFFHWAGAIYLNRKDGI